VGWALGSGLAVVLVAIILFRIWRRHSAVFASTHFVELAEQLQRIKDAACAKVDEPTASPASQDDRIALSSARISSGYIVLRQESGFLHRLAVSTAGGSTPHVVGVMFTVYFARLLGVRRDRLELYISDTNCYLFCFLLTDEEHSQLEQLEISIPAEESVKAIRRDCIASCDELRRSRVEDDS